MRKTARTTRAPLDKSGPYQSRVLKSTPAGCGGAEIGKLIRRRQLQNSIARVTEDVGPVPQRIVLVRLARLDQ